MGGPALAQLTPFEKEGCYNTVAIGFEHPKPGGSGKALPNEKEKEQLDSRKQLAAFGCG